MVMKPAPDCQTCHSRGTVKHSKTVLLLLLEGGGVGGLGDTVAHKTLLHLKESQQPSCEETSSTLTDHLDGRVKNNSNNEAYKLQWFDAFGLCKREKISTSA